MTEEKRDGHPSSQFQPGQTNPQPLATPPQQAEHDAHQEKFSIPPEHPPTRKGGVK